jgi:hypothetical protein
MKLVCPKCGSEGPFDCEYTLPGLLGNTGKISPDEGAELDFNCVTEISCPECAHTAKGREIQGFKNRSRTVNPAWLQLYGHHFTDIVNLCRDVNHASLVEAAEALTDMVTERPGMWGTSRTTPEGVNQAIANVLNGLTPELHRSWKAVLMDLTSPRALPPA